MHLIYIDESNIIHRGQESFPDVIEWLKQVQK